LTNLLVNCFFHTLSGAWKFFSCMVHLCSKWAQLHCKKCSQTLQISKAFEAFYAAGNWELCSRLLHNIHHDWNKNNQSQVEKEKKCPAWIYLRKQLQTYTYNSISSKDQFLNQKLMWTPHTSFLNVENMCMQPKV